MAHGVCGYCVFLFPFHQNDFNRHFPDGFSLDGATHVDAQNTPIGSVEQRDSLSQNDSNLCHLERHVAGVSHDLRSDLDQLFP
jgi:hypothetical protein